MRARQRHFNPGSAGAVLALDSRFISGINNGNLVSTWLDRSPNMRNLTQATSAARPTYYANTLGGQPVVTFNGTTNFMSSSDSGMPTGNFTIITVSQKLSPFPAGNNYSTVLIYGTAYFNNQVFVGYGQDSTFGTNSFGVSQYGNSVGISNSIGTYIIGTVTRSSSIYTVLRNGTNSVQKTMGTNTVLNGTLALGNSNFNGSIASVCAIPSNVGRSLAKRLEHSAAISFKIACS